MRLQISRSKNATSFYVIDSYRRPNGGGVTSTVVEKLGTAKQIQERLGDDVDPEQWARDYVKSLNEKKKAQQEIPIQISLTPSTPYAKDEQRVFNVGYLYLQKILYSLNFKKMVKEIDSRHQYKFNLEKILSDLIYARVIEPCSKRSSYEISSNSFLEDVGYELHDVYRALDIIAKEYEFIQSHLYQNSASVIKRNSSVLFYDCTNFYFECQEEDDLRRYGISKENRPNPIVQYGMFTDGSGIPLAFDIFDGSSSEQNLLYLLSKKS